MNSTIRETLNSLSRRSPRVVREHEILRVSGWIPGDDKSKSADTAIEEILIWAQKRSGGNLPPEAWNRQTFDHNLGGRNSDGIRLVSGNSDIWAIRADDPDKNVAERVWTTEVVIGQAPNQSPKFSARLLVSTPEKNLSIEPHTPGFVQQVTESCGLVSGLRRLLPTPMLIESETDADDLIALLIDPHRQLPIFVVTLKDETAQDHPTLDVTQLSRALLGLAHVALVHPTATWKLTSHLGKFKSVFGGAARVYMPGFSEEADPYQHRLVLAEQLATQEDASRCTSWIRQLAAYESVRRFRLGREVLPFAAIRNASLQLRQERLRSEDASTTDQLAAANARIDALEKRVAEQIEENEYFADEFENERQRAEAAEAQAQSSAYRIQQLTERLKESGSNPDKDIQYPTTWADFPDWCNRNLSGRLLLTARALGGVRKPEYQNVEVAARALLWLANDCRDQRINGGEGSINNLAIFDGVMNASCGSDTYEFDWNGRRLSADWHIKSGGNTRDPARCLRIYYCFDPQTQQIIVSDMPAHRRTAAT